ncbi:MAG: acetyl-CoA decarbonylase/synthase complex subunit delta [Candidatus Electrothrix sp.]
MKSGSNLERVLRSGAFAVTGELGPPKNSDPDVVREKARILKGNVDAVNITDCQTAIVRMSSIGAGLLAHAEGVEPVIQMTCRDRNRIGMQSDLLAASALGLKNLLCLTGDHQKFGNHPGSKGVFDMDSIQLLGMIRDMRDGKKFQCGEEIKGKTTDMFLGAAANPFAYPHEFRAVRMGKKIANGADFIQTQIIYNLDRFAEFMKKACELGLHEKAYILAGVTPPKSVGMARYMKKFVPGMDVTDEVIKRMQGAKDKKQEGINICVDIINQVKEIPGVAGVHVMAIEWEEAVPEICERAGLLPRPTFDDDAASVPDVTVLETTVAARETVRETIEVRTAADQGAAADVLEQAKAEAEKIIAAARTQAAAFAGQAAQSGEPTSKTAVIGHCTCTLTPDDAGEHAMNEKGRREALESVNQGLNALKKAYGLSDDQFDALMNFVDAASVLNKEPEGLTQQPAGATPAPVSAPTALAAPAVEEKTDDAAVKAAADKAEAEAKAKVEAKAEAAAKAEVEAKAKAEAEAKVKAEAAAQAEVEAKAKAKAEAEQKAAAEAAAKAEAEKKAAEQAAPAAAPSDLDAPTLSTAEETPFAERVTKVPASSYKVAYSGAIREVTMGNGDNAVTVGGATSLPFHLFEGEMGNKPLIAMEIMDVRPDNWPETLTQYFDDVMDSPVDWAKKCVDVYKADALNIWLNGTDPNGENRSAADAAKDAAAVIEAVNVPIIIWGCGNSEKDTETLREVTSLIGDKKVCLAPLEDANYRAIGATAMAFQHPMVAASPIDVNLAKQLNILLENLGVPLDTVMMDPSVGALGYGIEYTYSVMERIRIAALTQKDEKLQVPIICNLGREVWKAKEAGLPTDELLGDQESRGIMMEAITASCMLMAGGEVLIMRHPKAVNMTKALINGLIG